MGLCCVVKGSDDILFDPGLHKIIEGIQIWIAEEPQVRVQDVLHVRNVPHPLMLHCIANELWWIWCMICELCLISSFPIFLTSQSILPSNLQICLMDVPRLLSIMFCTLSTISSLWQSPLCQFFHFCTKNSLAGIHPWINAGILPEFLKHKCHGQP